MKTKHFLLLSVFAVFIFCSKENYYNKFVEFGADNRWQKADEKPFEFEVSDDTKSYNLTFRFSHVYDYQFATVPINFTIENPAGETENLTIDLAIKDSNGQELAECAGDVCDLKYLFKEKTKLSKGKYKITISHSFEGPYLPNVIGIGLTVEPIK